MTTITLYQSPMTGETFSSIKEASERLNLSYGYLRNQLHYEEGDPLKCANPPIIRTTLVIP